MFPAKWISGLAFVAGSIVLSVPSAYAAKPTGGLVNDDDVFMALRDAARRDDAGKAAELAERLPNYAIPSYVDYYRLKPRLRQASAIEIRDFLSRYDGYAIADRLRNDWLLELGRKREWAVFDEQYPQFVVADDTQVKCYALMSKAAKGVQVADEARALLVSPKDYGDGCQSLMATLVQAGQFNDGDLWAQIRLAAENNLSGVARRIATLTTGADEAQVVQAIDHPIIFVAKGLGKSPAAHEAYVVALGRVAKLSHQQAANALDRVEDKLTPQELAQGWAQIALQASYKLAPETSIYWSKTRSAPLSQEGYQWRARIALRNGDWKAVKAAIEAMPPSLKNDPAWIYWMGRALQAENKNEESNKLFQSIADQIQFYGQLATEELGQKISIPQPAQPLTAAELAAASANPGLRRALKFFAMNLRFEAVREWNWELRRMNEREHLAAAEFARQNNILDRMVNTSDRTKTEHDFTQRYPSPFRDVMYSTTRALGLDMAWVYGLIRQESRFIMNARSHVGASGLMQLMPATAKFVAKKIGLSDYDHNQVNDINTNIQLGANYLNMVLRELDGSQALATAAYNAGPGRPRAWRASLPRTVEGAVFAESIPFSETRGYVKNVLSNATYYAALFDGKPQSLKARLGMVAPKGFVQTELP